MFKIDASGADANNEFTEGNPAGGTPATVVSAEWLTMIQRELAALVTNAGFTLDKLDDNQLLKAIGGSPFRAVNKLPSNGGGVIDLGNLVITPTHFDQLEFGDSAELNIANGRHTPKVAGYYQYIGMTAFQDNKNATTNWRQAGTLIRKNGGTASSDFASAVQLAGTDLYINGAKGVATTSSGFIYMNGTNDYVELCGLIQTNSFDIEMISAVFFGAKLI